MSMSCYYYYFYNYEIPWENILLLFVYSQGNASGTGKTVFLPVITEH